MYNCICIMVPTVKNLPSHLSMSTFTGRPVATATRRKWKIFSSFILCEKQLILLQLSSLALALALALSLSLSPSLPPSLPLSLSLSLSLFLSLSLVLSLSPSLWMCVCVNQSRNIKCFLIYHNTNFQLP